jgi:hypothetical protein
MIIRKPAKRHWYSLAYFLLVFPRSYKQKNSPKYAKKAIGAFSAFGKRLKSLAILSGKIFAKFFMPNRFLANRKLLKSLHRQVPIFATLKGEKILAHFFAPNFSPQTLGAGQFRRNSFSVKWSEIFQCD